MVSLDFLPGQKLLLVPSDDPQPPFLPLRWSGWYPKSRKENFSYFPENLSLWEGFPAIPSPSPEAYSVRTSSESDSRGISTRLLPQEG